MSTTPETRREGVLTGVFFFYIIIYTFYYEFNSYNFPPEKGRGTFANRGDFLWIFHKELSRRIIADATSMFLDLPEESLGEYENAIEIKSAFRKAVEADRKGLLHVSLPKSITRT